MREPDSSLLTDCIAGKQMAIKDLYHFCFSEMYRVCLRYVHNKEDIHDIINSSFMKILKGLPDYKNEGKFLGWVKTICVNCSLDFVRKLQRNKDIFSDAELDYFERSGNADYQNWNNDLEASDVMILLHQLPQQHRIILNLFAIEGYSHKEIASKIGISEQASRWYVSTARKRLIEMINAEDMTTDSVHTNEKLNTPLQISLGDAKS
jgi:RNA polymerase sigma factor (sigma-70 family)